MTVTIHQRYLLSLALLLWASMVSAHEQSSENYTMPKNVLSNGGDKSNSSNYQMVATVGQYATEKGTANGKVLYSGFYAPRTRSSKSNSACGGITEGLVACYPFDGNANDASGNGNHGAVKGATLTQDRFGNANSAYEFDGIDDYIEIQNSDSMNPKHITVSAWYFATESFSGNGNNVIIHKPYTGHVPPYYQWHLGVRGDQYHRNNESVFHPWIANNGTILNKNSTPIETENFLGNWYHVVMSFDGNDLKLYLN